MILNNIYKILKVLAHTASDSSPDPHKGSLQIVHTFALYEMKKKQVKTVSASNQRVGCLLSVRLPHLTTTDLILVK